MLVTKPPMGWNSWNTFAGAVTDQVIRETADAIVSTGLKDAGYEYVVIDDVWSERERDENGRMVPERTKFPYGMKDLSDYVHSLGLKVGMYSCAGVRTCAYYPGSFDNEFLDAQTFAEWGVDFLKYDFCTFPKNADPKAHYNRMSMALKATGRDILFSACNWGNDNVETWIRSTGAHMYRSTGDIGERFSAVASIAKSQYDLWRYSGPNCYNDMDMLICGMDGVGYVGHPGLCGDTEYKTHFALWCMAGSPLMMGSDVRKIRKETIDLLTNKDLLRIHADPEHRPPIVSYMHTPDCVSMFKHMSNRQFALGFFNLSDGNGRADLRPWEIGFPTTAGFGLKLKEIFTGEVIDYVDDYIGFSLPAHDCKIFLGEYVTK